MTLAEIQQLYAACTVRPEVCTPEYSAMRRAQQAMQAHCFGIVGTLLAALGNDPHGDCRGNGTRQRTGVSEKGPAIATESLSNG